MQTKGSGLNSVRKWIELNYGKSIWEEIEKQLSEPARQTWRRPLASKWYSAHHEDELLVLLPQVAGITSKTKLENVYRSMGQFIANDNLSTIYKAMLKLANPTKIINKMPSIWATYLQPNEVIVENLTGNSAVVKVSNLPIAYLSLIACGWLQFALEKVGGKMVTVTERGWKKQQIRPNPMVFDLSWS